MLLRDEISSSECESYALLKRLLTAKKWLDADRETAQLVLKIAGREAQGWLRKEDVEGIPISELKAINQLWLELSGDRFGFTVQKQIWHHTHENYTEFGDRVGWRRADSWLEYPELTFDLQAPLGHLPAVMLPVPLGRERVLSFVLGKWRIALLSRRDL